ncbi:MAG: alpha-ketoglutarate-dependent dioxygenase AlkB [Acidobacteria bacterium]|nr:alpha-ketoglutarate-dependent dioxygenase AlkB [Acidobacteriota bacterium]
MTLAILKETLWRSHSTDVPPARIEAAGRIPRGFLLRTNFVSPAGQDMILDWVANHVSWSVGTTYGNRRETYMKGRGPLPEWGMAIGMRMREEGYFDAVPNQLYLIEYNAGGGIAFHKDMEEHGPVIAGLTLGSSRVIEFRREREDPPVRVLLHPGDMYFMTGEARYRWVHGIPYTEKDEFRGQVYQRTKGMSATWRLLPEALSC